MLTTLFEQDLSMTTLVLTLIGTITLLYFGRAPAHQLLHSLGQGIYQGFRVISRGLTKQGQKLQQRNREVLLAHASKESAAQVEREFARIQLLINRDLAAFPDIQRRLDTAIGHIEADYQDATDNPPLPTAWGDIVKLVADLPSHGDPIVAKVLTSIKESVNSAHKETLKLYQANASKRHKTLAGMQPHWRELAEQNQQISKTFDALSTRSQQLDAKLDDYSAIHKASAQTLHGLTSSALTQFFTAGLVLTIALLGGLINFQLIALPMSEMVSSSSYIGALKTSDIAALVIILIEMVMGVFLLESLQITHLFPMISSLDDRMRKRMLIISLVILTLLASIEASLAFMRDLLALDREALQQSLTATSAARMAVAGHTEFRWIPSIGQMVMGFILPFALAFIAIPLETFMHSLRIVLGLITSGALQLLGTSMHVLGRTLRQGTVVLTHGYDFFIMLPLAIETALRTWMQNRQNQPAAEVTPAPVKDKATKANTKIEPMVAVQA